jgi:hypothetical protein
MILSHAKIRSTIKRCGRQLFGIMDDPPFIYTIGNALHDLPELLCIGFNDAAAGRLLNAASEMMIECGAAFTDRELMFSTSWRFPVMAIHADPLVKALYTIQAGQFLGHEDYQVIQIVIPDERGRYPDDPRCQEAYKFPVHRHGGPTLQA